MRKELKEKKRIKIKNKRLIKRYPWLRPCDWYGNPLKKLDYTFTWFDDIERGWAKAFGMMMVEEIDAILRKAHFERKYQIIQIKEKYGSLRWYDNGAPHEIYDELHRVIDKYSHISENVCGICGALDVGSMTHGWIYPICKRCFDNNINTTRTYEEEVSTKDQWMIPNSYSYIRFHNNDKEKIVIDISDTVEKMRKRYAKINRFNRKKIRKINC